MIDQRSIYFLLSFVLAGIATAVYEGNTLQHDNLIGAVIHFGLIVFAVNVFEDD